MILYAAHISVPADFIVYKKAAYVIEVQIYFGSQSRKTRAVCQQSVKSELCLPRNKYVSSSFLIYVSVSVFGWHIFLLEF